MFILNLKKYNTLNSAGILLLCSTLLFLLLLFQGAAKATPSYSEQVGAAALGVLEQISEQVLSCTKRAPRSRTTRKLLFSALEQKCRKVQAKRTNLLCYNFDFAGSQRNSSKRLSKQIVVCVLGTQSRTIHPRHSHHPRHLSTHQSR